MTDSYIQTVTTPDQALAHLFFYCCFRDGEFSSPEIRDISDIMVASGLDRELPLKEEVASFRAYANSISDRIGYLEHLLDLIKPTQTLALYSYCTELCLSDGVLSPAERDFLFQLADCLSIPEQKASVIQKLIVEINTVQSTRSF